MEQMTNKEWEAVRKLKSKFSQELEKKFYNNDFLYYRFLKDRNFNYEAAEKLLRNHLQWRQKKRVDDILTEYEMHEPIKDLIEKSLFARDKDGAPVFYVDIGAIDVKGIHMTTNFSELERSVVYFLEKNYKTDTENCTNPRGEIHAGVAIFNMERLTFGFASNKRIIEDLLSMIKIIQNYYPEAIKSVYFINSSSYFMLIHSLLKKFVNQNILDKLNIYAKDGYQEAIPKIIDPDQLPKFLGGNLTDPDGDPLCKTIVYHPTKIPEKYYRAKAAERRSHLKSREGAKKLVLPRASFSEIEVEVEMPGHVIEWEFEIKSRDVGFGLFHREGGAEEEEDRITELVPLLRLDTEDFSETGMYTCEKAGTYIILFDNSYSWVRSKEIFYAVTVVNPKEIGKRVQQ